jgi:hypothetical protein
MFWILLVALYIISLPLNSILLTKVWYRWYPPELFEPVGETVDNIVVIRAQLRALLLFGLVQPLLATVPLVFGGQWWHYLICLISSTAYVRSGSPRFFLDRARFSRLFRVGTLAPLAVGAIVFTLIR